MSLFSLMFFLWSPFAEPHVVASASPRGCQRLADLAGREHLDSARVLGSLRSQRGQGTPAPASDQPPAEPQRP